MLIRSLSRFAFAVRLDDRRSLSSGLRHAPMDTAVFEAPDVKPDVKKEIPTGFADSPTDVAKLKALEQRVEKMLDKAKACTVGVRMGAAQGSGVIVSEDGIVLTAGHVSAKPGIDCVLVMPSGKTLKGKTLGRNGSIDSGMIKIVDPGKYPFAEMGKSGPLKKGQWVVAIGHPGGFRSNRTPVVRLGRILYADPSLIRTDCTLVGGDSGGPLFDLDGKVIGIHSRIGGASITENVHVPIDTYRQTWDRLAASQNWGGQIGSQTIVKSAGGKVVFEKKDKLTSSDPLDRLLESSHYKAYKYEVNAGSTYTFDLASKAFDAYLRLEDAKQKVLAEDDDGAGEELDRCPHRLSGQPQRDADDHRDLVRAPTRPAPSSSRCARRTSRHRSSPGTWTCSAPSRFLAQSSARSSRIPRRAASPCMSRPWSSTPTASRCRARRRSSCGRTARRRSRPTMTGSVRWKMRSRIASRG